VAHYAATVGDNDEKHGSIIWPSCIVSSHHCYVALSLPQFFWSSSTRHTIGMIMMMTRLERALGGGRRCVSFPCRRHRQWPSNHGWPPAPFMNDGQVVLRVEVDSLAQESE
jgi:hypothetical protein